MCTATVGATPVTACTCAASSIFSCGVRGTPGWANTLNRVPVLPNAHDGNSIRCPLSALFTALTSPISAHLQAAVRMRSLSVEMEDLGDPAESLVGPLVAEAGEERRHLRLPAVVGVGPRHPLQRRLVVVGLQVADKQPVVGEEDGVVRPAGAAQRRGHLGPDPAVGLPVLLQPVRPDTGEEADALHRTSCCVVGPVPGPAKRAGPAPP